MTDTYYRRGFGLKGAIEGQLSADYHSAVVDVLRAHEYALVVGELEFHLAREFGFCYGVDRAVDYAYETRHKFPEKRLFLVGEIIHNPHVNDKLRAMGIVFLGTGADGEFDFAPVTAEDVVIIPAFGVTMRDFQRLRAIGCVLVDTTCGSVLNVWKRVEAYARDGYTAIIHGKYYHEETKATASQAMKHTDGKYLVVFDMAEARLVCDFIEEIGTATADDLQRTFAKQCSPGFDFTRDLQRVGVANQTTMLSSESLAIAAELGLAMTRRWGAEAAAAHFRSFDTICSATQERQDAVEQLLADGVDLMVVVGGYNSSNTCNLAALVHSKGVRVLHIEDAAGIEPAAGSIRYRDVVSKQERVESDWLGQARRIGITAGASTPNNKIGETIARICETAGVGAALDAALV